MVAGFDIEMQYNEDFKEADHYFSQLVEMHPNSQYAPEAVKLAIISKHLSTGGSDYDGRKVAEARKLVDTALRSYPELANKESEFLQRQLVGITMQQAEKDYKMAEFYKRTGHKPSAYFYYEIVRRRYPGTTFAEEAAKKMGELRAEAEKKGEAGFDSPIPPASTRPVTPGQPLMSNEPLPQPRQLPPALQPTPRPQG